ncbi:flippase [Paraflavisolibacter sp. H34]|uniref:flippase n=1 Tax=Huijunlia imazamoxiresistens TaxID=3127457 RepID=UPI00301AC132
MDKKLRKNVFSLLVLQKANYLLPFIIVPYLTRVLGPENFGKISFVQAVVNYFLLVTEYGFNMSATQEVAVHRDDPAALNKIFWTTTFSKVLIAAGCFLLLLLLLAVVPSLQRDAFLYLLAFSLVIQSLFTPVWFFQGLEKSELIIPLSVLPKMVSLALVFFLVRSREDYLFALVAQCLVSMLASLAVCAWIFYRRRLVHWYVPSWAEVKEALQKGWYLFISTAAISLYTTSNTVLLGIVANAQVVGYFVAADKLVKGVQSLVFTLGHAAYPRINEYLRQSREKAVAFLWTCLKWMGAAGLAASMFLLLFAGPVVRLVFGLEQYAPSVAVLQILSVTPLLVGLSYVFGILGLLPFGFQKVYARIYWVTGLFSLVLSVPLAYWFHMYGVSVSVIIVEVVVLVVTYLQLRKNGIDLHAHVRPAFSGKFLS